MLGETAPSRKRRRSTTRSVRQVGIRFAMAAAGGAIAPTYAHPKERAKLSEKQEKDKTAKAVIANAKVMCPNLSGKAKGLAKEVEPT
jgi:hypothetical protein